LGNGPLYRRSELGDHAGRGEAGKRRGRRLRQRAVEDLENSIRLTRSVVSNVAFLSFHRVLRIRGIAPGSIISPTAARSGMRAERNIQDRSSD
jgi:hypothetical protein